MHRFALVSTLGLALMAVVLAMLLRWVAVRELEAQTLASHKVLARTLSTSHAELIAPLIEASHSLSVEALATSAEVQELNQVLIEPLRGMTVVRIKIYTPAGRLVYSTEADQIGEQSTHDFARELAIEGAAESKIIHRDTFNTSDGIIENRDLVETYVPLRRSLTAPVEGVFELYSDVTPLLKQIDRTQSAITVGVLAVLGGFYAVVLILFRRTDRELQREQDTTHRYLRELEQARSNLEERVAERTREVAESEQRFRDVAEAAGEFIWEVDEQGRFTYVSDRVEAVLGYKPEELIGRTPVELMPDEDAAGVRALFAERGSETSFANHEHRSIAKSGGLVWQSVSGVPIRTADGRIVGHRGANFDITPRKQSELQLLKLSRAVEQSVESILICDRHGRIEYVNPSFTRNSGYSFEEAVGQTPALLRSGEIDEKIYEELWRTVSAGHTWHGELRNKSKDGTTYWDDVTISPLRDAEGNVTHYLSTQVNISERKRRETALRESEERLRTIMDSTVEGIIVIDDSGCIELCNSSVETLFGYREGELPGQDVSVLMPEPFNSEHHGYIERYLRTEQARFVGICSRELDGLRRDGSVFPLELSVSEMHQGEQRKFVGVVRDLTDRKNAEEELEKTRQQYFHREKMAAVGQLAAGIIHEVGNPVAAIYGAVETTRQSLQRDDCPVPDCPLHDEARKGLDALAEQVARLTKITQEVSEFATPRVTQWQWLDLNQLVRGTTKLLRYDPRLDGIALDLELDSQLPAIMGSPDQLTQVIFNLLVNAEDACQELPAGQGVIGVSTRPGNGGVQLAIRDNGCGMDESALARAFEAYFTTKHSGQGLGLGLSLCRSIVAEHGGTCLVESTPGKGTTVSVNLPLNAPADSDRAVP
jgi:nitrogen fixation negative regulator NifL